MRNINCILGESCQNLVWRYRSSQYGCGHVGVADNSSRISTTCCSHGHVKARSEFIRHGGIASLLLGATALDAGERSNLAWGACLVSPDEDGGEATIVYNGAKSQVVAVGAAQEDDSFDPLASGIVWVCKDDTAYVVSSYSFVNPALRNQRRIAVMVPANRNGSAKDRSSSSVFMATVIGREPSLDLAVLKIERNEAGDFLPVKGVTLADPENMRVGQNVFLLGTDSSSLAGDVQHTISQGTLSGLGRVLKAPNGQLIKNAFQFDAIIPSPLLSSAGLFDSCGNLLGMYLSDPKSLPENNPGTGLPNILLTGVNFGISSKELMEAVPNLVVYGNASGRS